MHISSRMAFYCYTGAALPAGLTFHDWGSYIKLHDKNGAGLNYFLYFEISNFVLQRHPCGSPDDLKDSMSTERSHSIDNVNASSFIYLGKLRGAVSLTKSES